MIGGKADIRRGSTGVLRGTNLFDALRVLAASLVIIGHTWPLSGVGGAPAIAGIKIHHFGVYTFFVISGYLLARSWRRSQRFGAFIIRRTLRIFPGLFVVVILTLLVLGPVVTTFPASDYWGTGPFWRYLMNLVLLAEYDLPGVFITNPISPVNGSLWSLGPEFSCYLMLAVLGLLGARASSIIRALLAVVLVIIVVGPYLSGPLRTTAIAVTFFVLGSLFADVPRPGRYPLWPGLLGAALLVLLDGTAGLIVVFIVLPYVVVVVGSRKSRLSHTLHRIGDPSYGMYLWGFPVQQTLILCAGVVPLWQSIAIVLPTSIALGLASWHLVEKPAITLGNVVSETNVRESNRFR
ncbi:acyltransferase family protein [Leucobacter chinensis]|uniref:acyltransferase family protein n=1 Tax=Leucobacter chinensis TaxID=2851010 RepID=UPI001C246440|nr:acyltransferase [Leucobacter chinensis]